MTFEEAINKIQKALPEDDPELQEAIARIRHLLSEWRYLINGEEESS